MWKIQLKAWVASQLWSCTEPSKLIKHLIKVINKSEFTFLKRSAQIFTSYTKYTCCNFNHQIYFLQKNVIERKIKTVLSKII